MMKPHEQKRTSSSRSISHKSAYLPSQTPLSSFQTLFFYLSVIAIFTYQSSGWANSSTTLSTTKNEVLLLKKSQDKPHSHSSFPANHHPTWAWTFEGVGATLTAIGVMVLSVGFTNMGLRNQIACVDQGSPQAGPFGGCEKGSATEVKELEDTGNLLIISGWVGIGIGIGSLVVGSVGLFLAKGDPPTDLSPQPANNSRQANVTFLQSDL